MSYTSLLINTCTVRRYVDGAIDDYGRPVKTWADHFHLAGIACRWSTPVNREIKIGAEVVLADLQLFLNDVDITEKDRVIIGAVTYEVMSVMSRQDGISGHHKECFLRTVKN